MRDTQHTVEGGIGHNRRAVASSLSRDGWMWAWFSSTQALVAVSIALLGPGADVPPTVLWFGFVLAGLCALIGAAFATVDYLGAATSGGASA